jgi:hypothetical protein
MIVALLKEYKLRSTAICSHSSTWDYRIVSVNAHLLSFVGMASAVLANAHPQLFVGIAGAVLANAYPLSFVGIIKAVNAHSLSFASMPIVVLEEKINSALLEGLIVAALANVLLVLFVAVTFIVSEGDVFASRTEICVVLTIFCTLVKLLSITPYACFLV